MKKILAAILMLIVSLMLFLGTTYAWWSKQFNLSNNLIKTGNLDVTMYSSSSIINFGQVTCDLREDSSYFNLEGNVLFTEYNAEPGEVFVKYVRIKNNGTINLDYSLRFNNWTNSFGNNVTFIVSLLKNGSFVESKFINLPATDNGMELPISDLFTKHTMLSENQYEIYSISIVLSRNTSNDFMNSSLDFDLSLYAWQADYPDSKIIL